MGYHERMLWGLYEYAPYWMWKHFINQTWAVRPESQCSKAPLSSNSDSHDWLQTPGCIRQSIASRSRRWSFSSAQCWWDTAEVLGPVLGSPVQEWYGHIGASAVKGHEDDEGTGVSLLWGKAERAGTVQPIEEKAQRDLINVYKYWWGRGNKMEPGSSQWYPVTGQEAMGAGNHISVLEKPQHFILWRWPSTCTCCPERLWGLPPWRYSKSAWTQPWATCSRLPCFEQEVAVDDFQRSLPTSTIWWFGDSKILQLTDFFAFLIALVRKRKVSHKWQQNTANAWQRTKSWYF